MPTDDEWIKAMQDAGTRAAHAARDAKEQAEEADTAWDALKKAPKAEEAEPIAKATEHSRNAQRYAGDASWAATTAADAWEKITDQDKKKDARNILMKAREDKENAVEHAAHAKRIAAQAVELGTTTEDDWVKKIEGEGKRAADAAKAAKAEAKKTATEKENAKKASSEPELWKAVESATEHSQKAQTQADEASLAATACGEGVNKITDKDKKRIAQSIAAKAFEDKEIASDHAARAKEFADEAEKVARTAGAARTTGG